MKKHIHNLLSKLVIYLSRKNFSQDKVKLYQKKFLYFFLPIFIITTFRLNTSVEGSMLGFEIYASIPFLIINFLILSVSTLIFYLYVEFFNEILINYLKNLFSNHKQVVCAYSDDSFGDKVYEIEQSKYHPTNYRGGSNIHIHTITGDIYQFDDWRSFKFVGIRESRKLKLEHLKSVMNGN